MTVTSQKLEELRARLLMPMRKGGALLVVYPPEEELEFKSGYQEILQELQANGIMAQVLDFRKLVFEALDAKKLLQKAFQLDAAGSRDIHQNLAGIVQREAFVRVRSAADQLPDSVLCVTHTASLYPWISYSALLDEVEHLVPNTLVIPFPGTENGPALHFLGVKDGYNYRAARI